MDFAEVLVHEGKPILYRPRPGVRKRGVLTGFRTTCLVYVNIENSKTPTLVDPKHLELAH